MNHLSNENLTDKQLITAAMQEANCILSEADANERQLILFEDFNAGPELYSIYRLGDLILSSVDKAFNIRRNAQGDFVEAVPGPIADKLYNLRHVPCSYHTRYSCHPYISVILNACERYGIHHFGSLDIPNAKFNESTALAINKLVDDIQHEMRKEKIQEKIRNREKNAYKNFKSAIELDAALFDKYSRICIVRLDLTYDYLEKDSQVPLVEVVADIKALLKCTQTHEVFNHYLGYIGKLEYGEEKGFHFHFLFYFDGSKVRKDITKANLIGEFWQNVITSGQGRFRNCNKDKEETYGIRCAVGMVHYSDTNMRNNMRKVIGYITKSSQFLMAKLKPRARLFYRSTMPPANESGVGRPRYPIPSNEVEYANIL